MTRATYNYFMFFEAMHPGWQALLSDQENALAAIEKTLMGLETSCYQPPTAKVMRAFETDPNSTKVLIVGQDPYPTLGHAVGLAFACPPEVTPQPRSLQNIRAEIASDLGIDAQQASEIDVAKWQAQGVMLLNRTLTVEPGSTNSHSKLPWRAFTGAAIQRLVGLRRDHLVVILWGKPAQTVAPLIESTLGAANILKSAHPSPLSAHRGFFASKPFSSVNHLLEAKGLQPIDWKG